MARPRLGDKAMTPAERQRRRRAKVQEPVILRKEQQEASAAQSPEVAAFQDDFDKLLGDYLRERPALREHIGAIEKSVYRQLPVVLLRYAMEPIYERAGNRDNADCHETTGNRDNLDSH